MKRGAFCLGVSVCVLVLMTATAFAQLPGIPIRVNIPFDFLVRGKTLPAGEYEISRLSDEPQVLEISNIRNRHDHAAIETDPVQGTVPNHGKVVFHRYGDSYFLHEIWTTGLETGRELPASHQEKMLRRETLAKGESVEPQTVVLAIY
ncbi:MAG TPA: hypothetical protein VJ372_07700 [Pyrinomonadaceae bacterium]|nr:hypothetical protein [Pyrinomonadaceae bacterium]